MPNHVMIDIETLGRKDTPVILTVAVIKFDPFVSYIGKNMTSLNYLYMHVDTESCEEYSGEIDNDTLKWWAKQSEDSINEAFQPDGRVSIRDVLSRLYKFCTGCTHYWGHGAIFDYGILEHVAASLERGVPWQYWQVRDTRTLFDLADSEMPEVTNHHALHDAYKQVIGVQNVLKKLNVIELQ